MRIVFPSFEVLTPISPGGINELKFIELAARNCYKSEDMISEDGSSAKKMVKMLIEKGHEAMIEHSFLSVRFICDRGVSHELVRHREASFAQESTRYCNYSKGKFGGEISCVPPVWARNEDRLSDWKRQMEKAEDSYFLCLENGLTAQEARAVLPNSLKTEIIVSTNYREWRHILKLRTDKAAHPDMRSLMLPLLLHLQKEIPIIFDDIGS